MFDAIKVGSARSPVTVRLMAAEDLARGRGELPRGFRADPGETGQAPSGDILLGVGRRADLKPAALRLVGARCAKAVERLRVSAVSFEGLEALPPAVGDAGQAAATLADGFVTGQWRFDTFEGAANPRPPRAPAVTLGASAAPVRRGLALGLQLGTAVNEARRIAATPPNVCTPPWIAAESRRLARRHGLACRVIDAAAAARLGMGGLTSVGRGSRHKPCLVILHHRGGGGTPGAPRLVLVGKTITFDTGGYSLKVNNGMRGMKYDKCGGAAVMGAMAAIAASKLPIDVHALLPAAENMVSGDSYRPDDIVTMHNGVTVEVTNTDAEGRLVLADALAYACRSLKPTALVDIATLTGGVVTALGAFSAGLFCNDDSLRARLDDASERCGERTWRLPLWPEHREFMRSQQADILNSNAKREAHPIQGAAFLSYFVEPAVPWAHLDIAGVSTSESGDVMAPGPTGWGVRLLHDLAAGLAGERSSAPRRRGKAAAGRRGRAAKPIRSG